jgi:hypothetical protein
MPEKPEDVLQKRAEAATNVPEPGADQAASAPHEPDLEPRQIQRRAEENETALQNSLDKLGTGARHQVAEAPKEEPLNLSTTEVATKDDFRRAMDVMKACFTDPTDLESNQTFSRFFFSPELARYYMMENGKEAIGVELIRINPNVKDAMYCPYAGIRSDYRNMGIYPKAAQISDEQMRALGKDHVLYEFEDKRAIEGNVYPDENPEDVLRRIEGRQNFWKRSVDCHIVNDTDVPYCRPASDDPQKVQAYDSLAFRALDKNDSKWNGVFNEDKTAISRDAYERFYLEIMQLEYGNKESVPSKDELRAEYPAIDQFFKQLEAHPDKKWVSIDATAPRQKATPNAQEEMQLKEKTSDERARWQHVPRNGVGWERPLQPRPEGSERQTVPELVPVDFASMSKDEADKLIRKIEEAFGTPEDPTQAPPSIEQFKGLQNIDPYSFLLRRNDAGEVVGWSAIVPVSKQLADDFVTGKINENQIIAEAPKNPAYDALYYWAFYSDEAARQKGETINLAEAQYRKLIERHPTIRDHVAWGYSEEGAQFMHRMEQDLGIRIRKSPGSF